MAAVDRAAHRVEHGLPQPITPTDELLLAVHHELHLLRMGAQLAAQTDGEIELREPAAGSRPTPQRPRRKKT